jgi:RecG-like helicase
MINKKVDTYLEIESKSGIYNEIEEKLASRRSDAIWITDAILYSKDEIIKEEAQEFAWKLEMVYPKKNIAIINGKLAKINDIVDGARVVEIENLRVLLEHNERLEWVTLFQ